MGDGAPMTLPAFAWHRPATLGEACALSKELGGEAAFLAGGTELLPDFQRDREHATHLIALDQIGELRGISLVNDELRIGALTTIADVASSTLVRSHCPVLAEAARAIGSPPIRSIATIGGNFCRAVPCADTPPAAIALGARVRVTNGAGWREVAAEKFFTGARRTVLDRGELLAQVIVPMQPPRSGASYQRFARRKGAALAVAAVAARVTLLSGKMTGVRITLGAVSPAPMLVASAASALEGEAPSAHVFAHAAECCATEALPISDVRGSADFRRELLHVLATRALTEAVRRAEDSRA